MGSALICISLMMCQVQPFSYVNRLFVFLAMKLKPSSLKSCVTCGHCLVPLLPPLGWYVGHRQGQERARMWIGRLRSPLPLRSSPWRWEPLHVTNGSYDTRSTFLRGFSEEQKPSQTGKYCEPVKHVSGKGNAVRKHDPFPP